MNRDQKAVVNKIIKKYGPNINLNTNPETLLEILRAYGWVFDDPDGGSLPGGVAPPPPCIVEDGGRVSVEDLMRAVLKLTRDVAAIKAAVVVRGK